MEIDSRPSDALALAVRSGAPIFAAEDVIAESAIEFEHEVEDTEEVVDKFKEFLDQVSPEDFTGRGELTAGSAGQRLLEHPRHERLEGQPGRLGGLGQQRRLGQARDGVRLQHGELARRRVEHQVDAREAVAAEDAEGVHARWPARGRWSPGRASAGQTNSVRPIS